MKRVVSTKELKDSISSFVSSYHGKNLVGSIDRSKTPKHRFTFIDLFAGAGGFSEGFMQAHTKDKWFDFLLGSDIDENCELTHHVRYNHQMGLGSKFLRKNITDHDFIDELKNQLAGEEVDVVAGGPPCQSFSLAGRRREFDVKNDLFYHYLRVIREFRPKYFVMENVKGIANKQGGKIKKEIISQIRSIVSDDSMELVKSFFSDLKSHRYAEWKKIFPMAKRKGGNILIEDAELDALLIKFEYEITHDIKKKERLRNKLIDKIEKNFNHIVRLPDIPYQFNKSNEVVRIIRQSISMLRNKVDYDNLSSELIRQKSKDNIDGSLISKDFDSFLQAIDNRTIIKNILKYSHELQELIFENNWAPTDGPFVKDRLKDIENGLNLYELSYDGCVEELKKHTQMDNKRYGFKGNFDELIETISLYKITDAPLLLDSSNYGVPQKRERIVFLGCRKDQKFIKSIVPSTDKPLNLQAALSDLDTTNKGGEETKYSKESNKGRMPKWYNVGPPFYVKSFDDLEQGKKYLCKNGTPLNSEKSNQSDNVKNRLKIIRQKGGYDRAKKLLDKKDY